MNKDVEYLADTLIRMGVITEEGCSRLAGLFRALQAVQMDAAGLSSREETSEPRKGGRVAFEDNGQVFNHGDAPTADDLAQDTGSDGFESRLDAPAPGRKKRAPRGSFTPTKLELQNLRDTMTVKQIAELKGVSTALVNNKLRDFGLTNPGRGRPRSKR